jgi:hypothetical protein
MCIKAISATSVISGYRYMATSVSGPSFMAFISSYIHTKIHNSRKLLSMEIATRVLFQWRTGIFVTALNQNSGWCVLATHMTSTCERWLEMVNWPGQPTLQHRAMLHLCPLSPSCHQWLEQWFLWEINLTCNINRKTAFWSLKYFWFQIGMLIPHFCVWMFYKLKDQTKCHVHLGKPHF